MPGLCSAYLSGRYCGWTVSRYGLRCRVGVKDWELLTLLGWLGHDLCTQPSPRDVASSERGRQALSRAPFPQVTYTPGLHIYRPQTGSIELLLTGDGASQTAASVVWELEALAPPLRGGAAASQVLAASSMSGVATFEAGQRQTTVSIPISWSSVKDHDILPFGENAL